jgi:hypothetical protein
MATKTRSNAKRSVMRKNTRKQRRGGYLSPGYDNLAKITRNPYDPRNKDIFDFIMKATNDKGLADKPALYHSILTEYKKKYCSSYNNAPCKWANQLKAFQDFLVALPEMNVPAAPERNYGPPVKTFAQERQNLNKKKANQKMAEEAEALRIASLPPPATKKAWWKFR